MVVEVVVAVWCDSSSRCGRTVALVRVPGVVVLVVSIRVHN